MENNDEYNFTIKDFHGIANIVFKHYFSLEKEVKDIHEKVNRILTYAKNDKKPISFKIKEIYNYLFTKIENSKKGVDKLFVSVEKLNINSSKKKKVYKKYNEAILKMDNLAKFVNNNIKPQLLLATLQIYFLENKLTDLEDIYANSALYVQLPKQDVTS
jgi:hypothetical protein